MWFFVFHFTFTACVHAALLVYVKCWYWCWCRCTLCVSTLYTLLIYIKSVIKFILMRLNSILAIRELSLFAYVIRWTYDYRCLVFSSTLLCSSIVLNHNLNERTDCISFLSLSFHSQHWQYLLYQSGINYKMIRKVLHQQIQYVNACHFRYCFRFIVLDFCFSCNVLAERDFLCVTYESYAWISTHK